MAKAKPKTEPKSEPKTEPKSAPKTEKKSEPKTQPKAKAAEPAKAPPLPKRPAPGEEPDIVALTQGLAALQKKDWSRAVELLEKAVAETDRPEVRDRAQQFLNVSRQKAAAEGGKPAKGEETDPYLLAVYEKNRGRLQEALEISRKGGRDQKDDRFAYLVASVHAAENRIEEAAQALAKAVELNPRNRIHAFHDPDFAELRKTHRALFGLT